MEEKRKKNVEDIVLKLRQPVVITDRKLVTNSSSVRPFSILPVSVFHCSNNENNNNNNEVQTPVKLPEPHLDTTADNVKHDSLLSIVDKCTEANEKGEKIIYKNYNFDEVKDSSTQTSKTIIQLAQIEAGEMSPDSLSPTPREDRQEYCDPNYENLTVVESVTQRSNNISNNMSNNSFSYCRQNNLMQYLQSLDEPVNEPPRKEMTINEYPKRSLIETYLEKSKSRMDSNLKTLHETSSIEKMHYVQPILAENRFSQEEPLPQNNFRSQSLVDSFQQNYTVQDLDRIQPQYTRFTVKNVRERNHFNITYRDTIYERNRGYRDKRSNSFMLPTLASEQKSKLGEVKTIKRLISPTKRGRSGSPLANLAVSNRVEVFRQDADSKIPYIDQSKSEIVSPKNYTHRERKTLIERAKSPSKLRPAMPAADFQKDMMRIDQMSLTLLPSDDSLNSKIRGMDALSLTSTDYSLNEVLTRIQDNDWNISLKALADATELCRTMDFEIMMPHMITINQKLIELLRSPRSHVCRTACQAAGHLFESMKDTRGPEFNDIVDMLLGKTADANKFIRQDANLALDCMVTHIPTFHAIRALCSKGPMHKNHLVRCATVRLIICAVVIAGPDVILNPGANEHTRKRIFSNMIRFLEDKNLETRKYGERLYKVLSKEPTFDQYLRKYMDKEDLTRMKKTLKFLSGRK